MTTPLARTLSLVTVFIFIAALCVLPVPSAQAQAGPHQWDMFGGGSYVRTLGSSPADSTGWDAAVSERPYAQYPWLGGTAEGSGAYTHTVSNAGTTFNNGSIYNLAFGPMVQIPRGHIRPFGRVLFGVNWNKFKTDLSSVDKRSFAVSAGGGTDIEVSPHWAVRVQADWMHSNNAALTSTNYIRTSAGVVYGF